jgi:hypothetical protein
MANAKYWVKIGGAVGDVGESRFGFSAPDYAYDNIGDELGVTKISDNNSARGILFGANYPKPPRVRLSGIDPNLGGDRQRSAIRYVDPDKVGRVLNGSLNDAVCTTRGGQFNINQATMA